MAYTSNLRWFFKLLFDIFCNFHFSILLLKDVCLEVRVDEEEHNSKQLNNLIESYKVKPLATLKANDSVKTLVQQEGKTMTTLQVNSPLSRGLSLPAPKIKYLKDKNVCLRIACSAVTVHV